MDKSAKQRAEDAASYMIGFLEKRDSTLQIRSVAALAVADEYTAKAAQWASIYLACKEMSGD